MKRWTAALCALFAVAALTGCSAEETQKPAAATQPAAQQTETAQETAPVHEAAEARVIRVADSAGHTVLFTLNGTPAADSLYRQLPLTVPVDDFSTNEKIFYPEALDLRDTPHPKMEIGTLAYYAPWGNVVMFFDRYNANSDLYELGHASAGLDQISQLTGTITIEAVKE